MAMNKTTLGTAIANKIMDSEAPQDIKDAITASWIDIAEIIINHIKTATITVATGIPVSTTGTAAVQTGATTATASATIA